MIPGGKTGKKTIRECAGKNSRRAVCFLLAVMLLVLYSAKMPVLAADISPQPAPERLRVEALYDAEPRIEPPIGYNEFDKYYADLKCDKLELPHGVPGPSLYLNYYLQEVNKPYKPGIPGYLKEGDIPARTGEDNEIRLAGLNSGTVYYAYSRAYYRYTQDS